MERLLALLPRAVEQAARLELYFTARTTVWTILRSAEGLERLAGGIVPGESGRGWESGNYDEQVLRMRLDEDVIAFVRAIATMQNISASEVVAGIIEAFVESYHPESGS